MALSIIMSDEQISPPTGLALYAKFFAFALIVWVFFSTVLTAWKIHVLYVKLHDCTINFSKKIGGVICLSKHA